MEATLPRRLTLAMAPPEWDRQGRGAFAAFPPPLRWPRSSLKSGRRLKARVHLWASRKKGETWRPIFDCLTESLEWPHRILRGDRRPWLMSCCKSEHLRRKSQASNGLEWLTGHEWKRRPPLVSGWGCCPMTTRLGWRMAKLVGRREPKGGWSAPGAHQETSGGFSPRRLNWLAGPR